MWLTCSPDPDFSFAGGKLVDIPCVHNYKHLSKVIGWCLVIM